MAEADQSGSQSTAAGIETDATVKADFAAASIQANDATQKADFAASAQTPSASASTGNHVALPRGYVLQEYTIEAVLGVGGFGITYLAQDNNLQCRVALKEYLPNDLAIRTAGQTVMPRSETDTENYRIGLERFLAEARVLATFRHHNIVRVSRFFEANQTAYMVMDYEKGESLRSWVDTHGPVAEADVVRMFLPLLEGLETVHRAGVVHRDIKPANIYVRDVDGSLVLLDFGAARQTTGATSKSLTSIITPGYAPFEQYHTRGSQGPWTDLYALGGVLYWLATGQKPIEAPSRVRDDPLTPVAAIASGRFGVPFLSAVDWALAVDEGRRPHSVAEFRAVLTGEAVAPTRQPPSAAISTNAPPVAVAAGERKSSYLKLVAGAAAVATVAALAVFFSRPSSKPSEPPAPVAKAEAPIAATRQAARDHVEKKPASVPISKQKSVEAHKTAEAKPKPQVVTKQQAAPAGATAILTFEIVPPGESAELIVDERTIGRVPPMKEYRLPAGKHKVEIYGNKRPNVYHYWVDLGPNEKKNLWARFADD